MRLTKQLTFYCDPAQFERWKRCAVREERKLSSMIRAALQYYCNRLDEAAGEDTRIESMEVGDGVSES